MKDTEISQLIRKETERQARVINLIASENYVSRAVRDALGSALTNKYAEGYPGARYYGGNEYVDELERVTQKRALDLFKLSPKKWSLNVQPYSGSPANLAVYLALVPPGEKIMGLALDMGGHLTHGHKVSASGKLWRQVAYSVDKKTELLDYDDIRATARRERPRMIVAGFTAYSRTIDFKVFQDIAKSVDALFLVDMSHIAGLVAGGVYPSPFPHADIVMTTMHKTLRGPRAALIFSRPDFSHAIDRAVFPGVQGGPHAHQIAASAIALREASSPSFRKYAKQVVRNADILARALARHGWRIISGGTDTHVFLMDTMTRGISGGEASNLLESVGIIVNKNTIPYDTRSAVDPSGIRIGTPAVTTRGMKEKDMEHIADWINTVLHKKGSSSIKKEIQTFIKKFPVP